MSTITKKRLEKIARGGGFDFKEVEELARIVLAVMTAPDSIPPHVEDAMGEMCDGGFNAQGIWDLCRESVLPPAPCPRCGTVSERPDGLHYCHAGNENDK